MTGFAVPLPALPSWVSIHWTPTRSAAVVQCARCRRWDALYTTLLRLDPDSLTRAVAEHASCEAL